MKRVDVLTLLVLGALWGGSYVFIRIGAPALGPTPLMAGRVAAAAVVLWVATRASGHVSSLRSHASRLLVLGLINSALPSTLIATAELRLNASFVAVLGATAPLFAALLGALLQHERVSVPRAAGLLLGVLGVATLSGFGAVQPSVATAWSITATLLASLSYAAGAMYAKHAFAGVSAPTLAFGQQLGAFAWLAAPAAVRLPYAHPTAAALGALAALAILSTALAFVLYFRLIARVGPTLTSTVTYIVPAFGMLFGALFLRERITGGMVFGFGVIAVSVALVNDGWIAQLKPRVRHRLLPL